MNERLTTFVKSQLAVYTRTNGLTTKEEMTKAMNENKIKWVKMYILING